MDGNPKQGDPYRNKGLGFKPKSLLTVAPPVQTNCRLWLLEGLPRPAHVVRSVGSLSKTRARVTVIVVGTVKATYWYYAVLVVIARVTVLVVVIFTPVLHFFGRALLLARVRVLAILVVRNGNGSTIQMIIVIGIVLVIVTVTIVVSVISTSTSNRA